MANDSNVDPAAFPVMPPQVGVSAQNWTPQTPQTALDGARDPLSTRGAVHEKIVARRAARAAKRNQHVDDPATYGQRLRELENWKATLHGRDVTISDNVITVRFPPVPKAAAAANPYTPFQIVDNGDGTIAIIYGTLNDTVPDVAGGFSTPVTPPQALASLQAGSYTLYLNGDLSSDGTFAVTASHISTTAAGSTSTTCSTIIGMVNVTGGIVTIFQNLRHSQWFTRCPEKGDQFGAR
jgi:hypothetical protein